MGAESSRTGTGSAGPGGVYLTADLPGIGGRIKERAEDFLVDEQPLYQPSGEGEHIYLFIEKKGMSTAAAVRDIARHFGVHESAVGYAGLKDKLAVTRQVLSVHAPGKKLEDFPSLKHERIGILWADYHANKLRRGHLLGNRFSVKIRGVPMQSALLAHRGLLRLEKSGVPNRIGEQRFGYRGLNHLVGRAVVLGDYRSALDLFLGPAPAGFEREDRQMEARLLYEKGDYSAALVAFPRESRTERNVLAALKRGATPAQAIGAMQRWELDFYLTAFQSAIFNVVLDQRLREGMLGDLRTGDVAMKHENRAAFAVREEDLAAMPDRLAKFEVSPSGPMWGPRMMRATGATDALELDALHASGVTLEQLEAFGQRRPGRMPGERRLLRVPLMYPDVEGGADEHGSYVRVAFDLPRGAFATTVLRELMKPGAGGLAEEGEEE